ncbi:hypothetical protein PAXINDRAFT_182141 [Paxillus involutus ATCC 200175]|uniref:Protein arginine N-methyltransferase domain-containing protein n=1 Tax=Paxillus involutus ATCC 200175 TaxID=664439 RepID=A0A0C9SPX6_PAXIN|nr:hypothetical protein PAXINDRAFT_182141 [Paxillus involutus ATCC 200175]
MKALARRLACFPVSKSNYRNRAAVFVVWVTGQRIEFAEKLDLDDEWSDDEDTRSTRLPSSPPSDLSSALRRIQILEEKLSQAKKCGIMLALCEGSEIMKDRVDLWGDVYGFDLSEMAQEVWNEAIVDVVGLDSVVNEPSQGPSPRDDFTSTFTLTSTSSMRTKIHALILCFDTFFTTTCEPLSPDVPYG